MAADDPRTNDFENWHKMSEDEKLSCIAPDPPLSLSYDGKKAWDSAGCLQKKWNNKIHPCVKDILDIELSKGKKIKTCPSFLLMLSIDGDRRKADPYIILQYRKGSKGRTAKRMIKRLQEEHSITRYGFRFAKWEETAVISGGNSRAVSHLAQPDVVRSGRANSGLCGMSVLVRPSLAAESANCGRLATIGGVFQLSSGRYFALVPAHVFTEPVVVDDSSSDESETSSHRPSSVDDDSLVRSDPPSSQSSTQSHHRFPEEHTIFEIQPTRRYNDHLDFNQDNFAFNNCARQIGVAFSQSQRTEFPDMLYNASLDWALVEILDRDLWADNLFRIPGRILKPRPGSGRTTPPTGNVLVLSVANPPVECRSLGTKALINVDWVDHFVEVWAIEYKSGYGSCGSWVVDPFGEVIVGILVAHSEDQPLAWMLPADPIFADIEERWKIVLADLSNRPPPSADKQLEHELDDHAVPDSVVPDVTGKHVGAAPQLPTLHSGPAGVRMDTSRPRAALYGELTSNTVQQQAGVLQGRLVSLPKDTKSPQSRADNEIVLRGPLSTLRAMTTLPRDILDFIEIKLNQFREIRAFLAENPKFRVSAKLEMFDDAAIEAVRAGDIVLVQQCIQRRMIISQCRRSMVYLDRLIRNDPEVAKNFSENCILLVDYIKDKATPHLIGNNAFPTPQARGIDNPTADLISDSNASQALRSPGMSTKHGMRRAEDGTLDSKYPVARGPFDPPSSVRSGASKSTLLSGSSIRSAPWSSASTSTISERSSNTAYSRSRASQSLLPSSDRRSRMTPHASSHYQRGNETQTGHRAGSKQDNGYDSPELEISRKVSQFSIRVDGDDFGDPELLDSRYTTQNGKDFFVKGRVFEMMYPEPQSLHRHLLDTGPDDSRSVITDRDGKKVYIHEKRFVVIRQQYGSCLCVPINLYEKTGVGRNGLSTEDREAHAIIYDEAKGPSSPILPGEESISKRPIAVHMYEPHTLGSTSRIHFGRIYAIKWNVKAISLGEITKLSETDVELYWTAECIHRRTEGLGR